MEINCKACGNEFDSIKKKELKFSRFVYENVEVCELCATLKKIHEVQLQMKKLLEEAKNIAKERNTKRMNKGSYETPVKNNLN